MSNPKSGAVRNRHRGGTPGPVPIGGRLPWREQRQGSLCICAAGSVVRFNITSSYQRKWFDTADFWQNGPRVFYTLRPQNREPFDTPVSHAPSWALESAPSAAFVRGRPPGSSFRHAGIASGWPTSRKLTRLLAIMAFQGTGLYLYSFNSRRSGRSCCCFDAEKTASPPTLMFSRRLHESASRNRTLPLSNLSYSQITSITEVNP